MLPYFLSIGVSKAEFDDSTPNELQCYVDADDLLRKRRDAELWQLGMYNMSAFSVALSKALAGRKSHAKYIEEPMLLKAQSSIDEENATEEEKQAERDKLLMRLQLMQSTFEANQELTRGKQE